MLLFSQVLLTLMYCFIKLLKPHWLIIRYIIIIHSAINSEFSMNKHSPYGDALPAYTSPCMVWYHYIKKKGTTKHTNMQHGHTII